MEQWMKKHVWVCRDCGSRDIEIKAWVRMNGGKEPQWVEADAYGSTDYWCEACQSHTEGISLEDYEKYKI